MKGIFNSFLSVNLKKKAIIGYIVVSVFFFFIIYMLYLGMTSMRYSIKGIDNKNKIIQTAIMLKTNINGIRASFLRLAIDNDKDVWENQEAVINKLIDEARDQINTLKDTPYKDKVSDIERTFIPFSQTIIKELIPAVKSGNRQSAINILSTVQVERSRVFISAIDDIIKHMEEDNNKEIQSIDLQNRDTIIKIVVLMFIIFTSMVGISYWFINNYIIKVLNKVTEAAQSVSKGELGVKVEINIDDEFGRLARDVNNIINTIKDALSDISYKTFVILQDVTVMSFAGQEVCHRIDKDLQRTTSAATATEEMSSTSADISKNVHILAEASEVAKSTSMEGKEMLVKTTSSIEKVNDQIKEASKKLQELTDYSKKIDNIVVLIKDIADQTNLLALNAAIEAARAGEQGRGFAVVADEVRKLAYRTTNATVEINGILNDINRGTNETTVIMEEAVNKSEDVNQLVMSLKVSFDDIFDGYLRVTEMVQQIVAASEEQTATASEIAKSLSAIAEDAKHSSKDIKEMASSFINFTANAKAFLKTINNFKDKKIEIGVIKSDYILWLNRVIQLIDSKGEGLKSEEMDPRHSRMGKWYYGIGKELYGNLEIYKRLEERHVKFHELGKALLDAGKMEDRERVRNYMKELNSIMKEIFDLLDKIVH